MTAPALQLRDGVYTAIALEQTLLNYSNNGFTLQKTYLPIASLEKLNQDHTDGICYLIHLPNKKAVLSRTNRYTEEVAFQIGYQHAVSDNQDATEIDVYTNLFEEILDTIRDKVTLAGFSFLELDPLRDQSNNIAFSYVGMRDNVFEAYYTARFHYTYQG